MLRQRFSGLALAGVIAAACGGGGEGPEPAEPGGESPAPGGTAPASQTVPPSAASSAASRFPDWPKTDFSKSTIDLAEVQRGCPGRDCIPPLDARDATTIQSPAAGRASFLPAADYPYEDQVPIAYLTVEGKTRGYPLPILTWHEVVNDRIGGTAFVATYCPLCNTAMAFDRTVDGRVLDFGVSGNLRNSDLVMWDRQTESWWQQATGEGIAGTHAGARLRPIAMTIVSYRDFVTSFPDAEILTEITGQNRAYGLNPYGGYDTSSRPFLFDGKLDERLPALERVVTLREGEAALALPFSALSSARAANVTVGGKRFAVLWAAGTVSALDDQEISTSRDVGSAVAFEASFEGRQLTFDPAETGRFTDRETGSTWDITGRAVAGPLQGTRLSLALHTTQFWFAWAAFNPRTEIWKP